MTIAPPAENSTIIFPVQAVIAEGFGTVNVRSGPGTTYEVVSQITEGTPVMVVGISEHGDWYQLAYAEGSAWIYGELLDFQGQILSP